MLVPNPVSQPLAFTLNQLNQLTSSFLQAVLLILSCFLLQLLMTTLSPVPSFCLFPTLPRFHYHCYMVFMNTTKSNCTCKSTSLLLDANWIVDLSNGKQQLVLLIILFLKKSFGCQAIPLLDCPPPSLTIFLNLVQFPLSPAAL